ncbi:acyltransferase family protein [Rhizobium sp. Root1203]|uniref:acyltransferase family protein n=1 Tax=Rhizobium sp. Root1203 TaxID=1736427 RepID=UPI0009EB1CCD|nr:acyltransferase family protein [Rhizobium sp. Root1203]
MLIKLNTSAVCSNQAALYRPEVDGLRAVAVLPVILFHAGVPFFSGGYIGVDIFFVISGFLITSIIARDIDNGRFSIVDFYERRARRILPALFVVILACLPLAWLWMLPNAYKDFSQSLMATVGYASNVLFYIETGYFDVTSAQKPLLHTWSLSVEEQFYVVFPLLLLGILKFGRRLTIPLLAGLALASIACSEWLQSTDPEAGFYMIFSRAWELLFGAIGALAMLGRRTDSLSLQGDWLSLAGLLLIVGSLALFPTGAATPGLLVVPCVVGTVLVLMFARSGSLSGRLLSLKPLVWVGLISYSAYLWHQPLLAFLRLRSLNEVSVWTSVPVALMSLPIAWISWRYVERPFRDRSRTSRRTIFAAAIAFSTVIFAVGAAGQLKNGFPERLSDEAQSMAGVFNEGVAAFSACLGTERHYIEPQDTCLHNRGLPETAMLYGDSHGATISRQVAKVFAAKGASLREFTHSGCMPVPELESSVPGESCRRFNTDAMSYLENHPAIDTVVLVSRWTTHLEGSLFNNDEGGNEGTIIRYMKPIAAEVPQSEPAARIRSVSRLVQQHIKSLLQRGKKVVLIYQIPEAGWDVPAYLTKEMQFGIERHIELSTASDVNKVRNAGSDAMLDDVGLHPNLLRIKPAELFCDTLQQGRCLLQKDGRALYIDDDHLSQLGASIIADRLFGAYEDEPSPDQSEPRSTVPAKTES